MVQEKLRYDESAPDLDEQFRASSSSSSSSSSSGQDAGAHRYFVWPYTSASWGEAVEHMSFVPLPQRIKDYYQHVECASFMGLLPEIHRYGRISARHDRPVTTLIFSLPLHLYPQCVDHRGQQTFSLELPSTARLRRVRRAVRNDHISLAIGA